MGDRFKAFWLGVFIIASIAILIWLVMFLKPSVGDKGVELRVLFSNIDKISKGSRVTYAGKPVGEVISIHEVKDPEHAPADPSGNRYVYELVLGIDSSIKIYSYDEILFTTVGLMGEKSIAIIPKAPPPGAPPPRNITHEVLYANASDKLNQTLDQLSHVANTLESTMREVCCFIQTNKSDFNQAICSLTRASNQLEHFIERACRTDITGKMGTAADRITLAANRVDYFLTRADNIQLIEKMGASFENIGFLSERLASGEGTLAKLINSDCFYVQFTTMLSQLRAILDDINHYGLLYQFDRKWKRSHRFCTEIPRGS